jgi:hypothetical protein
MNVYIYMFFRFCAFVVHIFEIYWQENTWRAGRCCYSSIKQCTRTNLPIFLCRANEIVIPEVRHSIFVQFLQYVYCDQVEITPDTAMELFQVFHNQTCLNESPPYHYYLVVRWYRRRIGLELKDWRKPVKVWCFKHCR